MKNRNNIACRFWLSGVLILTITALVYFLKPEVDSKYGLREVPFEDCELIEAKGEEDFRNFLNGKKVNYPLPESCNLRYFYGIVEKQEFHSEIEDFCVDMESNLPDKTWNRCVFGVGHGVGKFIEPELKEKTLNNRMREMLVKAHKMCNDILPLEYFGDCVLGVYNYIGIEVALSNKNYNVDLANPFSACSGEEIRFKRFCYNQLVAPVFDKVGRNFEKAFYLVEMIDAEEAEIYETMSTMASYMAFIDIEFENVYRQCLGLVSELQRSACISGYASGLVEIAPETVGYEYAYKSCMSNLLNEELKEKCVSRVFADHSSIKDQISLAAVICIRNVKKSYSRYCGANMNN